MADVVRKYKTDPNAIPVDKLAWRVEVSPSAQDVPTRPLDDRRNQRVPNSPPGPSATRC